MCKKSVCFYCITTFQWRIPVNHFETLFPFFADFGGGGGWGGGGRRLLPL